MARHSNGQDNYKVAGWVIAVAIAVIVAIIALLFFLLGGRSDDDVSNSADSEAATESIAETTEDQSAAESGAETSEADSESVEETSEAAETSEEETPSQEPEAPAAPAAVSADTLLLLDTSDGLSGQFESVTGALANTARALSADGKAVALWNYSSPLSPGVTVGYRDNLGFGSGEVAANTITNFGTGGAPQSRSAVVAAVDTASDRAAEINGPVRVLMVTTGTASDMDEASFTQAFEQAAGENVELSVVHVGPGEPDAAIERVATEFKAVDGNNSGAVADALKAAAGA